MLTLSQLTQFLRENNATFEIIGHPKPIITVKDAEEYFDRTKAAPVFIMQTDKNWVALIVSTQRGKIDFKHLGKSLGFSTFKMAEQKEIIERTGYAAGEIPLIGHGLPCLMDKKFLELDFIYGGTGSAHHTLKITPQDVARLSQETKILDWDV